MKTTVLMLTFMLVVGCKKDDPAAISFDDFSFVAPSSWKKFEAQGYDSKVGGITNGKDTLRYDMGMYSYAFTKETGATHYRTESKRNGFQTLIVRPKTPGKGLIGIYIKVDDYRKLTIYGESTNEEEILKILESVRIH